MLRFTLSGLNYQCLQPISVVKKMFEPLKFDCIFLSYTIISFHKKKKLDNVFLA